MSHRKKFTGGVFHDQLSNGRAGVDIELHDTTVTARTSSGELFTLPYRECGLELGGASGRMVFCRNSDRSVTIFCEDRQFLGALESHSRGLLAEKLAQIHVKRKQQRRRSVFWWSASAAILAAVIFLGYLGVMNGAKAAVSALPTSVDKKVGQLAITSMNMEGPVVNDRVVQEAFRTIVERLLPHTGDSGFDFTVRVIDAPLINAFALPGGQIVVFTGLINQANSPEQVSAVLAHEMAHVTCRHGMQRVAQSMGVGIAVGLVLGDTSGFVALAADLAQTTALRSYSRDHETEADTEGVRMMHAAGLDPLALAGFFDVIEQQDGDVPDAIAWLSSHPQHQDRVANIRRLAKQLPGREYTTLDINWDEVRNRTRQGATP